LNYGDIIAWIFWSWGLNLKYPTSLPTYFCRDEIQLQLSPWNLIVTLLLKKKSSNSSSSLACSNKHKPPLEVIAPGSTQVCLHKPPLEAIASDTSHVWARVTKAGEKVAKHAPNLTKIGHRNSKNQTLIKEPKKKKILRRREEAKRKDENRPSPSPNHSPSHVKHTNEPHREKRRRR
jgi:hypothetical protein